MKFNELSNEEIVFTSILYRDMLMAYENVIEAGGLEHVMESPLGKVHIFKELTPEDKDKLESSEKLKLLRSLVGKLQPIVDLILDVNPEMESELETVLFGDKDGEENENL